MMVATSERTAHIGAFFVAWVRQEWDGTVTAMGNTRLEMWMIPNYFAQKVPVSGGYLVGFPNFVPIPFGLIGLTKLGYQKVNCSLMLLLLVIFSIAPFYLTFGGVKWSIFLFTKIGHHQAAAGRTFSKTQLVGEFISARVGEFISAL